MTDPELGQLIVYQKKRSDGTFTEPTRAAVTLLFWAMDAKAIKLDNGTNLMPEFGDTWEPVVEQEPHTP